MKIVREENIKMATSKEYKEFILEQLDLLDDINCRAMMGEYLLYYKRGFIWWNL